MGFRDGEWRPDGRKPEHAANLRVCLALLRIYRNVRVRESDTDHAALALPFWPLLRLQRTLLRDAISGAPLPSGGRRGMRNLVRDDAQEHVARWLKAGARSGRTLPLQPPENVVLEIVGEAMVRGGARFRPLFDALEADLERRVARSALPADRNVDMLGQLLALTDVERGYLALAAAVLASSIGTAPFASAAGGARLVQAVQSALPGAEEHDVRAMMRRGSRLLRSGLLDAGSFTQRNDLEDMLRVSRLGMLLVTTPVRDAAAMAAIVLRRLPQPVDDALAWPHLEARSELLRAALAQALATQRPGVNILLYGAPGTGKTQYAAQVVQRLGAEGFSVMDTDPDGDPASREERLGSLLLTQVFAPRGRSVVVLDEAEDIFQAEYNNPLGRMFGRRDDSKSWVNGLLERNVHPVLWISNRIDHLDPAYLRRFTYCLQFPATPRQVRREVVRRHLAPLGCSTQLVESIAADPNASPALVSSAANFTQLAGLAGARADAGVKVMLGDMLEAMGCKLRPGIPERATRFDLRYLHAKGAIGADAVLGGLERLGRGRLLLSGPPGTGKTQLAAEIAQRLGRELVYRTASDINSMWFGQSERNVARLFEECEPQQEILFLDEADTLLAAREASGHRPEVAVTAEFLRQVEAFQGVFVCATNFGRHIDAALLRRFEYRLEMLPLRPEQREALFCETALGWSGEEPRPALAADVAARLHRLDQLTPGDFANVVRRVRALQLALDPAAWVGELEAEHAVKPGAQRAGIGFV
ncbi:AAA family ATPase [Ramlibacter sp. USB13]|uniref:AAA family ATPase n=1 Tax=Ramlibacter cellulosilyticus TaxID=2764187 RepID=A0A923SAC2_9BURK|nr:AAA family ATPase [Ramlibacter cellulosilyticus]MBC5782635.1 AAA family ATPase [Ramlibacter cellulosilyticus]